MASSSKTGARIAAFAAGLALAGAVFFLLLREPGETLTPEGLERARTRWSERNLRDYDLVVDLEGSQHGTHRIRVRGGEVTEMTTGEAAVPRDVWKYWTVEGMFTFLETELANAADPARSLGVSDSSSVVLRADFDAEYGYPRTFLRHVMGRENAIRWEIRRFEPAPKP